MKAQIFPYVSKELLRGKKKSKSWLLALGFTEFLNLQNSRSASRNLHTLCKRSETEKRSFNRAPQPDTSFQEFHECALHRTVQWYPHLQRAFTIVGG